MWSGNPLPLNPTWELSLTQVLFHITAANALQEAVCRKITISNNTVITQVDPPISPPLSSHSTSPVFPPGSQTSPVLCGVRALQQGGDHSFKLYMKDRCGENQCSILHFYRPNRALTFKLMKLNSNTYGHTLNMASVIKQFLVLVILLIWQANYCLKYVNYR